jgi:PKHD-type hydroxylase
MNEPLARMARILQPIRDEDAAGPGLTTDRGTLAHNPSVVDVAVIPDIASAEECARIIRIAAGLQNAHESVRIPRQDATKWIYERAAEIFEQANRTFRFRVVGLIEEPMVTGYGPDDKFPWQVDCSHNFTANRKLSLSLLLTDAGPGGEGAVEFVGRENGAAPLGAGTAIVFPSFLAHRVKPVSRERRAVLRAYAYGPTFE